MEYNYAIKYVSASNKTLDLTTRPYFAHAENIPSWNYDYVEMNGKPVMFHKGHPEIPLTVNIVAADDETGNEARNALFEIPSKDLQDMTPGRLYLNDWYLSGYMKSADILNYWQKKSQAQYELVFVAVDGKWVREVTNNFTYQETGSSSFLDYEYDFDYDYDWSQVSSAVDSGAFESFPLIRVYGPATNPRITISGNTYGVDVELSAGDYVEIDARSKTITKVAQGGVSTNEFSKRYGSYRNNSGSFVFQKIQPGIHEVTWGGNFDFDVVIFEERGEPQWI